jgi:hypothetical protein
LFGRSHPSEYNKAYQKPFDVYSEALKGHEYFIKGLVPDKHALNWLALTDLLRYVKLAEI